MHTTIASNLCVDIKLRVPPLLLVLYAKAGALVLTGICRYTVQPPQPWPAQAHLLGGPAETLEPLLEAPCEGVAPPTPRHALLAHALWPHLQRSRVFA